MQSAWLDYIQRDLMVSGELNRLIREAKIKRTGSNPSIFENLTQQLENEGVAKFI